MRPQTDGGLSTIRLTSLRSGTLAGNAIADSFRGRWMLQRPASSLTDVCFPVGPRRSGTWLVHPWVGAGSAVYSAYRFHTINGALM